MEMDKEFWEEFINIYKLHECLWNNKIEAYADRNMRNAAYNELVEKCKEKYPAANKDFVRKRIHSMRCSFRREFKKVQMSKRNGSSADDVYVPTLWHYNALKFIADCEIHREIISSLNNGTENEPVENNIEDEVRRNFYI